MIVFYILFWNVSVTLTIHLTGLRKLQKKSQKKSVLRTFSGNKQIEVIRVILTDLKQIKFCLI